MSGSAVGGLVSVADTPAWGAAGGAVIVGRCGGPIVGAGDAVEGSGASFAQPTIVRQAAMASPMTGLSRTRTAEIVDPAGRVSAGGSAPLKVAAAAVG